ncbi:IQUB [Symbiodinium natans]|uniref:IQUB protein n=1 Tax=Symbiodinium natans TaxID=878477 RepID=A0A812JHZ5_9DINO|nr:IQUB [Symbiodinium natans]
MKIDPARPEEMDKLQRARSASARYSWIEGNQKNFLISGQLFDQKPCGFQPSTPKSLATSQTVAGLREDSRLQEMSMYVTARGGTPLPALGPRAEDDFSTTLSPMNRVRSVPTESPSPQADTSVRAFYSRTGKRGLAEAGSTRGFGSTQNGAFNTSGYLEQTSEWSNRQTQSRLQRGAEATSMRRSRSTFNPYSSVAGSRMQEGDSHQGTMTHLPSAGVEPPPRPSTREAIAGLRAEGLSAADNHVRKLASMPSANESVEELYRKRTQDEDAVPPLHRQTHSMPDLNSDSHTTNSHATEASRRYNDDVDRWLRRLLVSKGCHLSPMNGEHAD